MKNPAEAAWAPLGATYTATVKGGRGLKLESGGEVTVKGTMIRLN